MRRQLIVVPLAGMLLLTACTAGAKQTDDLQIVANPVAATAPVSPAARVAPAGQVIPAPAVTAVVTDPATHTLAIGLSNPPSVRLLDLTNPAAPSHSVALSGPPEQLSVSTGQLLASVPTRGRLAKITLPGGQVDEVPVDGQPAAGVAAGGRTLVAVRDRKAVEVLQGDQVTKTIAGPLYSADDVISTGGATVVLDRLRTAVFRVDVEGGKIAEGLRAGDGATNAVADGFGRVLVTDTRAGALIAFSTAPLLMRQRYPVPGGAYGLAYDTQRNLAWVTLTERNEVVGFDVRGGEPVEKYRFPTVRQPDSVAVDPLTGRVFVGSATGEGIQVITL